MKKYFGVVLFLIVTVICLSGCFYDLVIPESDLNSEDTEDVVVPGKGTLKIYLIDASGNYKENDSDTYSAVYITISNVEGHIAGDDYGTEGSWEPLKEWSGGLQVDLIKLDDVSILLASLELEPNKYTQLRLFLMGGEKDAWVVLEGSDGPEGSTSIEFLEIPSSANTGIKLNRPFEIVAGWITKLTIDFDAEKSVVKTGNGKYKLKPVIHVTSETYSEGEELPEGLGSVSGSVSYYESGNLVLVGIVGASIELSGGVYIFANTDTTLEGGSFSLDNVPAGNYTLNVDAVYGENYYDYSENIEVIASTDTVVDVVFLVEEPGGISGSVVDSVTESAIGGATVTVTLSGGSTYSFDSSADTDESGGFVIDQLPVGTYDLTASAIGYENYTAGGIVVTEGTTTENIEIELIPE